MVTIRYAYVVFLLMLAGCSSGWLPFSSGELEGVPAQAPDDWTQVASKDIVQLETDVDEPYSVDLDDTAEFHPHGNYPDLGYADVGFRLAFAAPAISLSSKWKVLLSELAPINENLESF